MSAFVRSIGALVISAALAGPASAQQQCPTPKGGELPLKYTGGPTVPAITPCDLMTRLYIFADDSMRGRRAGTADNLRATGYIESELRRLGLTPAGDNGTFFQALPVVSRSLDTTSTITAGATTLKAGTDFLVTSSMLHPAEFTGTQLVYGGTLLDTTVNLPASVTNGRVVIFRPIAQGIDGDGIQRTPRGEAWVRWYNTLRRATVTQADQIPANAVRQASNSNATLFLVEQNATVNFSFTPHAVEVLLGAPLATASAGTVGAPFRADLKFVDTPRPARNVVASLPGTDAKLRGEYVALGAHSDHAGVTRPIDHDSLRAVNVVSRPEGANTHRQTTEDDEYVRIAQLKDSLHKARPIRMDSIYNGADVGGSGTVSLLEIAEALAKGSVKPKRSVLFVWHAGSELGTPWGSTWFTSHPTVSRDSIVAFLNLDAVGHGEATDETGVTKDEALVHGNPNYVQLIGARRQSTELGALVESVNALAKPGMSLDYSADADGHPDRPYCRNDQWVYGRYGIPTVFFTTGAHADWREPTDEPQYIQYQHMARVDQLVLATALRVANLDHRLTVDKPKPDPLAACQQ